MAATAMIAFFSVSVSGKSDSSSDSQPALLRLIWSAMDLYLFLRASIFCRHCTSVR